MPPMTDREVKKKKVGRAFVGGGTGRETQEPIKHLLQGNKTVGVHVKTEGGAAITIRKKKLTPRDRTKT